MFLLPVFSGYGKMVNRFIGRLGEGIALELISGMTVLMLIFSIVSFFTGLSLSIEIVFIGLGLTSFFYFKGYESFREMNFIKNPKFLFSATLILFVGSYFPFILDHFGYYLPTLKWLAEVGLVKGIANLDLTLGQMSFWHMLQAGLMHFADPFLRLNTFLLLVYLIYTFENKSWIHLIFLPFLFLFAQSPSPDLPVIVFSLILLDEVFRGNRNMGSLFVFSMLIFSIKPTMIWVPIFVFLYGNMIIKTFWWRWFPGVLILILFFVKNLWTFGYPIFPIQWMDLNVAWKPNSELMQISSELAIKKTFDMQYSYQEIQSFSFVDYIRNWLFLKGIKSIIHLAFISGLLFFAVFSIMKKKKFMSILCLAIVIKSILVLLFSAQYRFFLDVFFVLIFVFARDLTQKKALGIFSFFSILFLIFFSSPNLLKKAVPSFKLSQFMYGFQKDQLYKPSYFEWKKYESYNIGNLDFYVVKRYPYSFDIPIPAISPGFLEEDLKTGIFPQKRGKSLKPGFYWRKLTEKEQQQLEKILEKWKSQNAESGISKPN